MLLLYRPKLEDLWFREALLGDEATMSYNRKWGGVIDFPREKWQAWYERWLGGDEDRNFYRYLFDEELSSFVGETAFHYDEQQARFLCDVIVLAKYRGRGYGGEGLRLLCESAREKGIRILYDDIARDNPAVSLFLRNGFEVDYETDEIIMVKKYL